MTPHYWGLMREDLLQLDRSLRHLRSDPTDPTTRTANKRPRICCNCHRLALLRLH